MMSHDEHVRCDEEIKKLNNKILEQQLQINASSAKVRDVVEENEELRTALEKIKAQHLKVWTTANNALV